MLGRCRVARRRSLLAILLLAAVTPLSGCLDVDPGPEVVRGCVADGNQPGDKVYVVLVAHDLPDDARPTGERALFAVNVLAGQTITIDVRWEAQAGLARALVDGVAVTDALPRGQFSRSWPIDPGIHTVEVEGAPTADLVTVTPQLLAVCPPATG